MAFYSPASKKDEPEIWECRLMGEFIFPRTVEFTAEEVGMIRELSWKTGVQRSEVIREAVRRLYDDIVYKDDRAEYLKSLRPKTPIPPRYY